MRALKAAAMAVTLAFSTGPALAQDAGHDKDYRTFHQDGTIDYGKIGDS